MLVPVGTSVMTITVDVRERRSGVPEALRALGVGVTFSTLPAGDYVVGPGEVVERKTVADLHSSIATCRLWRQLEKLRAERARAWLLIEGRSLDRGRLSMAGVRGALLAVVETGVPLLWSESPGESAVWIQGLCSRSTARRGGWPWVVRAPRRARNPSAATVLTAVPGISPVIARRLLEHFGSIETVAAASRHELVAVSSIGEQRARTLTEFLSGASREARSAQAPRSTTDARTVR